MSKTYGLKSDDIVIKSLTDLWPKVLWYHIHIRLLYKPRSIID